MGGGYPYVGKRESMSVIKSKRSEGKLGVLTQANNLCVYTVQICKNEKYFPKRDRWIMTQHIVHEALDVLTCVKRANAVNVQTWEDYTYRRGQQVEAYSHAEALLTLLDVAYCTLCIEDERIEFWTGQIINTEKLLMKWRESDRKRYKSILQPAENNSAPVQGME